MTDSGLMVQSRRVFNPRELPYTQAVDRKEATFIAWGLALLISSVSGFASSPAPAERLAREYMRAHPAQKLGWNWGDGLVLLGLTELSEVSPALKDEAWAYVRAYHAAWQKKGIPSPNRSDECPPALSALKLYRQTQEPKLLESVLPIVNYVRTEPRNSLGALNHLGHWFFGKFYPASIWVDSLMMYGVFAGLWAQDSADHGLMDFALSQPRIFSEAMQDPEQGLFYHAYAVKRGRTMPEDPVFWLRGNGWVLASIADLLELSPPGDPKRAEMATILERVASALASWQQASGFWTSVVQYPDQSQIEASGTALVAYALLKAVRLGHLPESYRARGLRAYEALTRSLVPCGVGLCIPNVSGPTNPGGLRYYARIRNKTNLAWGVAAYLRLAQEVSRQSPH